MTTFTLNGRPVTVEAEADTPLLWVIRDDLGLTGTKFGCGIGMCGACTVHLDGQAIRSCITLLGDAAGATITTIEGLDPANAHPVQKAWVHLQVPQCGYCQSGGCGADRALSAAIGRGHRRDDGWQPLPLHDLRAHPCRNQGSCFGHGGLR